MTNHTETGFHALTTFYRDGEPARVSRRNHCSRDEAHARARAEERLYAIAAEAIGQWGVLVTIERDGEDLTATFPGLEDDTITVRASVSA